MKRRKFITLLGGAAGVWPLAARAQQSGPMPAIGFLSPTTPETLGDRLRGFRQGLKETGFVEGENVVVVYRWAENQMDRLPELAAELVRRQGNVIAASTAASALAVKGVTTTIPSVFLVPEDRVRFGLVASLARPGGNLTGVNLFTGELSAKRLELLREMVPGITRVAALVNPTSPSAETTVRDVEAAARAMGLQIQVLNASTSPRNRCGLRKFWSRSTRLRLRHARRLFEQPACPIGEPGVAPRAPRDIYESRLC